MPKLEDVQHILEEKGFRLSPTEITELMIKYTLEHVNDFLELVKNKYTKEPTDPLIEWLYSPISEKKRTNSVDEHDVII